MSFYRPLYLTWLGVLISLICALGWPAYGLIYTKLLFVMMSFANPKYLTFSEDRAFWCGMFLLLILCLGIFFFIQKYIFFIAGENLTFDIRNKLYQGIIYKNISWFDRKDRAPGILSNVLSEDIGVLNGMTTEHLAILIEAYGGLILGLIIALCYTWKMGLVTAAFAPLISFGGVMMSRLAWKAKPGKAVGGIDNKNMMEDPYQMSNALLSDILMNYRTVISFGEKNVDFILNRFDSLLEQPALKGIREGHYGGFFFGYS
jgi:ABC-type multidrug transport system fused ATPase/permease subunit